jgi:hypothetical protein
MAGDNVETILHRTQDGLPGSQADTAQGAALAAAASASASASKGLTS